MTTHNQCIACRLDDGITIITGIKGLVAAIHNDTCQVTVSKHSFSDGDERGANGYTLHVAGIERKIIDVNNRVGNRYALHTIGALKCAGADGNDRGRDDSILTTRNQLIVCRLNDGITIITGIISRVATFHSKISQIDTPGKRLLTDGGDRCRDGHARQVTAIERRFANRGDRIRDVHVRQKVAGIECVITDSDDGVGDNNVLQAFAPRECILADGDDRVSGAVVGDSGRDNHSSSVAASTGR